MPENGEQNGSGLVTTAYLMSKVTGWSPFNIFNSGNSTSSGNTAKQQTVVLPAGGSSATYDAAVPAKAKVPLTRGQILRRRIAVIAGVGLFGAVLATDNNNLLRLFENAPLIKQSVRQVTQPGVARLGSASEISFNEQDHPYVVVNRNACLYEFANNKTKTDICFDQGHKVFGAVVQPQGEYASVPPTWLAVQVRHGSTIVGNAYMSLRDVKAEPSPEAAVPPATVADYEMYLKKPPAKAGAATHQKHTPGG